MKITSDTLKRIAAMPAEAMAAALLFLAEQLEADEAKRNANATRQQRYRERHSSVTVTPKSRESNADVTPRACVEDNIYKSTLVDISIPPIVPPQNRDPDGFDAFWDAYPKRDGNADRKGAVKAFGPAVKRAGDAALIARAAARYAAHCREKGKLGTEFVKQARSWLNGDLWREWLPQEPTRPAVTRVAVREGTTAWDAWKRTGRRFNAMDLKDENGHVIGRGWYFESEFPPQERAA